MTFDIYPADEEQPTAHLKFQNNTLMQLWKVRKQFVESEEWRPVLHYFTGRSLGIRESDVD